MTPKLLDCTLRDGGYYNDWDFARETVSAYLHAMEAAKVDAVEIGFRNFSADRFLGPYAFSTDDFLKSLPLPKGVTIGVMVDAKELLRYAKGGEAAVDALFAPREKSPVGLVRIAAHFTEAAKLGPITQRLKKLGYQVGLNLMQAGGRGEEEISAAAAVVQAFGAVDVLYFADSLGNMDAAMTCQVVVALRKAWKGPLGIHAHDNMGRALANSLAAFDAGAEWLDATVLGMGRGAGNTRIEYLLMELTARGLGNYQPDALFPLVLEKFEALKVKYDWGTNLLYYLSAAYGIHPTYVQVMLADDRYRKEDIVAGLAALRDAGGKGFSQERLEAAMRPSAESLSGSWDASGWAKGRDVLIVAPGVGAVQHREALLRFIENKKPLVIALNATNLLPSEMVSAFATCDPLRFTVEAGMFVARHRPVVVPAAGLSDSSRSRLSGVELLDFGINVAEGSFAISPTGCTVPRRLVAAYALGLAASAGAKRVLLAGFDGFTPSEPRHKAMLEVFELYEKCSGVPPLLAVTPTSYPIPQTSIYAPDV
jgi:4-hydroxy 2-oxovalerate aldolase